MSSTKLEMKVLESHSGRNVNTIPVLLRQWRKREGYIPSEGDMRYLGSKRLDIAPEIAAKHWGTSTLSAIESDTIKVILPYDNSGSYELTKAADFGLSLITPDRKLVDYGINLNGDEWQRLSGDGVYTINRKNLNPREDLTIKEAMEDALLLTKLGHPDYVETNFARPPDEIKEIITKTFESGKFRDGRNMMGQLLHNVSDKRVMNVWYIGGFGATNARSSILSNLDNEIVGRMAFCKTVIPKTLTVDKIYSAIESYIAPVNEPGVRRAISTSLKGYRIN
jgi:hypothetical protein